MQRLPHDNRLFECRLGGRRPAASGVRWPSRDSLSGLTAFVQWTGPGLGLALPDERADGATGHPPPSPPAYRTFTATIVVAGQQPRCNGAPITAMAPKP